MTSKRPFSEEEDIKLAFLVNLIGEGNYSKIAEEFPDRSVREIRERYIYRIKPNPTNRDISWTEEEDRLLECKYEELGSNWDLISSFFPGKTTNNVRNRYNLRVRYRHLKKFDPDETIDNRPESEPCGREVLNIEETLNQFNDSNMNLYSPKRIETELNYSQENHPMTVDKFESPKNGSLYEGCTDCGNNSIHFYLSKNINGYTLENQIGNGATSSVALCKKGGVLYAAKIIPMHQNIDRNQIENEIAIMRELDHPNILKCIEHFQTPDGCYTIIILEHCDRTLFDAISNDELTPDQKQQVFVQIASAIIYMHRRFITHRDIKIENILMQGLTAKIADFGFAVKNKDTFYDAVTTGTMLYWPPESYSGKKIDMRKGDDHAFGIICYMLATCDADFYNERDPKVIRDRTLHLDLPINPEDPLQLIAGWLTTKDPNNRPTIEQVLQRLNF